MPKPYERPNALPERNEKILTAHLNGVNSKYLAETYGITVGRINTIIRWEWRKRLREMETSNAR